MQYTVLSASTLDPPNDRHQVILHQGGGRLVHRRMVLGNHQSAKQHAHPIPGVAGQWKVNHQEEEQLTAVLDLAQNSLA